MKISAGTKTWKLAHIEKMDWLLITGLTLAPMTGLRIWKVGPGEVLCLLWGARFLFRSKSLKSSVFLFFVSFLLAMGAGSVVGYFIAPSELSVEDLLTWIYLGVIAISLYEGLKTKSLEYNETLFFTFAEIATLWYLFLYLYSKTISKTFLGVPIWYHTVRFAGCGTNPHQVALLLCTLTFVFLRSILKKTNMIRSIVLMFVSVFLMLETASSTGVFAIAIGVAISAYFFVADLFPKQKAGAILVLTGILLLIAVVFARFFYRQFINWVSDDSNGMGRLKIYASFGQAFARSPLFGLGPGVHGIGGTIEFHNTYMEILAATGMIGGLVFAVYSISLIKKTFVSEWKLFVIVFSMYAYCLASFAMRRLVFWGIVAFATAIAEQLAKRKSIINE